VLERQCGLDEQGAIFSRLHARVPANLVDKRYGTRDRALAARLWLRARHEKKT
jgi:hypothetical protein